MLSGMWGGLFKVVTCSREPAEELKCQMDSMTTKFPHTRALGL